jgi:hypothetical protein
MERRNMKGVEDIREKLASTMTEVGGRLKVRSALNPMLYLCGIVVVPYIPAVCFSTPPVVVHWIVGAVVASTLLSNFILLVWDRDRLQSEDYLIRRQTLELIEEKGSNKAIDAATVEAISGPEFLALDQVKEGNANE